MMTLVFHLINFSLTIALGVYLFRKYMLSDMRQEMAAHELLYISLKKRLESLKKQEQSLEQARVHQTLLYQDLVHKMDRWKEAIVERHQKETFVYAIQQERMRERLMQQQHALQELFMKREVLPRALADAKLELVRSFSSDEQEDYNERIIHFMQKVDR